MPFILKASGGDILADPALSSSPEAFAAIYWDTSGASTAQRVFGFARGGVSGTGTSQKSVGSLIVGNVVTATVDGVTRTFIDGAMVGSSRVSSSQLPHIIDGDASPAFGGGASFGQDNFFYGDNAGFFVMEGVEVNSSGIKILVGTNKIEDTFGTVAAATKYSPNTVFSQAATGSLGTRTTRSMNGYVGGLLEGVLSDGTADTSVSGRRIFWSLGNSGSEPIPTSVIVQTSATTNKVHVHFNGEQADGTPGMQLFLTNMGDEDPVFGSGSTTAGDSAFLDNTNFGAIDTVGATSVDLIDGSSPTEVHSGMATVICGRRLIGKGFSVSMQSWSDAVICSAC